MTLLFRTFIVSSVSALIDDEVDVLTVAGVDNSVTITAIDLDSDLLNDADKFGLGSL